ncbi:hypothetical protein D3C78_1816560 [compost metagenome]
MTNKPTGNVETIVKRFFERQKSQHHIGGFAYFENALLTPGPNGRADIVNSADATLFQATFQGDIEVRRVDTHKHVRREIAEPAGKILADL